MVRFREQSRDKLLFGCSVLALLTLSLIAVLRNPGAAPIVAVLLAAILVLVSLVLSTYRRIHSAVLAAREAASRDATDINRQTEALFSLFSVIRPRLPFPPMGVWAISADFARLIASLILELKPKLVVEASSGVSTLIAGYCLEKNGEGAVLSLEHDEGYWQECCRNVKRHGLDSLVKVAHSPLTPVSIRGRSWLWYDTAVLASLPRKIDMVIIDGPPAGLQDQARYPALPLLLPYLSDTAVIVLDDAAREGEIRAVNAWCEECPEFTLQRIQNQKGAAVLRRNGGAAAASADASA